jgi:hypothetical protein
MMTIRLQWSTRRLILLCERVFLSDRLDTACETITHAFSWRNNSDVNLSDQ